MATRKEVQPLSRDDPLAESLGYAIKRRLLGPPLVTEQIATERLSKPLALGVLSCDGISSAAYGTEEILIELLPAFGVAGFAILMPMTAVVLLGVLLVVLLYREVVSIYTRAGGSYVVARENFGPRVAQVAAVALLIDYIVTVAVQVAAGSAAIVSAFPQLGRLPLIGGRILDVMSVVAILIMCYGNLRGIREAGRAFALPTYIFSGSVGLMIVAGLYREFAGGGLHAAHVAPAGPNGTFPISHQYSGMLTVGAIYILLRAFANGGSSLTGIEAVSNAVSALRRPEGHNARQILVMQGSIVAFLIAGISWIAHLTHATPYQRGYPTVLAQEAQLVFGRGALGQVMFYLVQLGTATILFTGGNTSFSGFPFLASFVAEDAFLPRWLSKRGHRLVFSGGIITLTVISLTLGVVLGFNVNHLVPLYAIGVFTGFTMAGYGMVRFYLRHRSPHWRRHLAISLIGGTYAALVVLIFAVVKFTEGAFVVVILFPVMVYALIRVNREYRMEAHVLEDIGSRDEPPTPPTYARRTVFVFVDEFDLATLAGLRYARSLRPTSLRAVHFIIDSAKATKLREDWLRAKTGVSLDLVDCPDRRLTRGVAEMVQAEALLPGVGVTAVLPRRTYSPFFGRLIHDRTADQIAAVVSQIPHAAATIVPFDVRRRVESLVAKDREHFPRGEVVAAPEAALADGVAPPPAPAGVPPVPAKDGADYNRPAPSSLATPIADLPARGKAVVEGRVHAVEIRPVEQNNVLAAEIMDSTGQLTAMFYGRTHIPGLDPGVKVRFTGQVGRKGDEAVMINPAYELLTPGTHFPPRG